MPTELDVRVIGDQDQLRACFSEALAWCDSFTISTAWASTNEGYGVTWDLLKGNLQKLQLAVVGIHFLQTEPWILWRLQRLRKLNLAQQADGTFHPKVYLFEKGDEFRVLIGSANLTVAGFSKNTEASVLLSGPKSSLHYREVQGIIEICKRESAIPSDEDLKDYEDRYNDAISERRSLTEQKTLGVKPEANVPADLMPDPVPPASLDMSWDEYWDGLKTRDAWMREQGRGAVFDNWQADAQGAFKNSWLQTAELCLTLVRHQGSLASMNVDDRKYFCGTTRMHPRHGVVGWFGSMLGQGHFQEIVNQEPAKLDHAFGLIPQEGGVSEDQLRIYFDRIAALPHSFFAGSFRLLSMKRPDLFCNINRANRQKLSELADIPSSELKIPDGFLALHERIWRTRWFKAPAPVDELQFRSWRCRAALLDAICYDPTIHDQ